jgi:hypothetical protein
VTWGGAVKSERARTARRIGLLTLAVLAVHLWLLGAVPGIVRIAPRSGTFIARTVAAPVLPPAASGRAHEQPPAPNPVARVAPPPPAPGKQERTPVAPRGRAIPSAPAEKVAAAQPAASAPAIVASAPSTHASGAAAAPHVAVAPSARYHYVVTAHGKGLTLNGSAVLDWRHANGEYEAELSTRSPIPFVRPRTQRSAGRITPQGLEPLRFSDKTRSEEATHFDRENGRIVFSTNKPEAPLEPGVQDRLSIVMQLSAIVAGEPSKYRTGSTITVQTASTKEAEPWTFTVEGTETLDLPGGRLQAMRLVRNPRREYDTRVELWLAPGAAYAPVRLRLTQPNGDWVDQQWSSTDRG